METWGGTDQTHITKIQKLQDSAAKMALSHVKKTQKLSKYQRRQQLKFNSIQDEIKLSTMKMTYKIINQKIPEQLSEMMAINNSENIIQSQKKLQTKPKFFEQKPENMNDFQKQSIPL